MNVDSDVGVNGQIASGPPPSNRPSSAMLRRFKSAILVFAVSSVLGGCGDIPAVLNKPCSFAEGRVRVVNNVYERSYKGCWRPGEAQQERTDEVFESFISSTLSKIVRRNAMDIESVTFVQNSIFRRFWKKNRNVLVDFEKNPSGKQDVYIYFDTRNMIQREFEKEYGKIFDWNKYSDVSLDQYKNYLYKYTENRDIYNGSLLAFFFHHEKFDEIPPDIFWLFVKSSPGIYHGQNSADGRFIEKIRKESVDRLSLKSKNEIEEFFDRKGA